MNIHHLQHVFPLESSLKPFLEQLHLALSPSFTQESLHPLLFGWSQGCTMKSVSLQKLRFNNFWTSLLSSQVQVIMFYPSIFFSMIKITFHLTSQLILICFPRQKIFSYGSSTRILIQRLVWWDKKKKVFWRSFCHHQK